LTSETKQALDWEEPAATKIPAEIRHRMQFYRVRHRIYTGLLAFVVVAGLPVVGVPLLRHRLGDRVQILRLAITGGYSKMVTATVGENHEPFPGEYEHAAPHRNYPQLPAYLNTIMNPPSVGQVYPPRAERKPPRAAPQTEAAVEARTQPAEQQPVQQAQPAQEPEESQNAEPVYRQGKLEQEVYDVLLKSDANVAGLVQGKNPSYHFKSWDVAKREEDLYWVRIVFTRLPGNIDTECIWQVQLMSKQVMPLSSGAKSLPRS